MKQRGAGAQVIVPRLSFSIYVQRDLRTVARNKDVAGLPRNENASYAPRQKRAMHRKRTPEPKRKIGSVPAERQIRRCVYLRNVDDELFQIGGVRWGADGSNRKLIGPL